MPLTVNMENLTNEERAILMYLLKKANEEPSWPQPDDLVWAVGADGTPVKVRFKQIGESTRNHLLGTGKLYRTKEDAQFAIEREKVLYELEQLSDGADASSFRYVICTSGKIVGHSEDYLPIATPVFSTRERACEALEKIGNDRISKYLATKKK